MAHYNFDKKAAIATVKRYRLEFHSKQEQFNIAEINEPKCTQNGWMPIMEIIPENTALDFIEYAEDNLLNTNTYYTWRMMQTKLHEWLSKQ